MLVPQPEDGDVSDFLHSDFLQLAGKTILVVGVANKKSVAWHVSRVLVEAGADVVYSVRSEDRRESVQKLVGDAPVFVCDVEYEDQIARLAGQIEGIAAAVARDGAFDRVCRLCDHAGNGGEDGAFHETPKAAFLRAVDISCFSLMVSPMR